MKFLTLFVITATLFLSNNYLHTRTCEVQHCSIDCTKGCMCIEDSKNPKDCECRCTGGGVVNPTVTRAGENDLINISLNGSISAKELENYLNEMTSVQVVVPKDFNIEKVKDYTRSNIMVADMIKELGLKTVNRSASHWTDGPGIFFPVILILLVLPFMKKWWT